MSDKNDTILRFSITAVGIFFAAASLSSCGFKPGKTITHYPDPIKMGAISYELLKRNAADNQNEIEAASRFEAARMIGAVCDSRHDGNFEKQLTCANYLKGFAEHFADTQNLSPLETAYVEMGADLEKAGGYWGCITKNNRLSCYPLMIVGNNTSQEDRSYTQKLHIKRDGVKKLYHTENVVQKDITKSHAPLSLTAEAPAQDMVKPYLAKYAGASAAPDQPSVAVPLALTKEVAANSSTIKPLSVEDKYQQPEAEPAQVAQKAPEPAVRKQPEPITKKLPETVVAANEQNNNDRLKRWLPIGILGGVVASAFVASHFADKTATRSRRKSQSRVTTAFSTVWDNRKNIIAEMKAKKHSIILGGLGGAGTRIVMKFILAKMGVTAPAVAAGASLSTLLPAIGLTVASVFVVGALAGGVGNLLREVANKNNPKNIGWKGKAFREGLNSGAMSALLLGGVADMFMSGGFLHDYVGKPVAEFTKAQMPDLSGVKSFFANMFNFTPELSETSKFEEARRAASGAKQVFEQVPPDHVAPQDITTPTQAPTPAPEPVADPTPKGDGVTPPTIVETNVPKLFNGMVSQEVFNLMGQDDAGRAIQEKMILASKHPNNTKFLLSAYKDASEYLLNDTHGSIEARQAAKEILVKGYETIGDKAISSNTGKNIVRDLVYVLKQDGGAENLKMAAEIAKLGDPSNSIIKSALKLADKLMPNAQEAVRGAARIATGLRAAPGLG